LFFVREIEENLSIFLKCIKSVHSSPFKSYYLGGKAFKIRRKTTGPEHAIVAHKISIFITVQRIQKPLEAHMIFQHHTPRDGLNREIKKYPISLQNGRLPMLVF